MPHPGTMSGKKVWKVAVAYSAMKDLPEIIPLAGLLVGGFSIALYTMRRVYFGIAGDAIPSVEMRRDYEKQISIGRELVPPSLFWRVAQWRKTPDGTVDVGVYPFHNKAYKYDHSMPTHPAPRPGLSAEGPYPTEY